MIIDLASCILHSVHSITIECRHDDVNFISYAMKFYIVFVMFTLKIYSIDSKTNKFKRKANTF